MYEKKLKVEKVELVKKLIRSNNYNNHDTTLQMCLDAGINVNMPALVRFADKLALLDNIDKPQLDFDEEPNQNLLRGIQSGGFAKQNLGYDEVKRREQEITFELGALRIREHELLNELQSLSTSLKN